MAVHALAAGARSQWRQRAASARLVLRLPARVLVRWSPLQLQAQAAALPAAIAMAAHAPAAQSSRSWTRETASAWSSTMRLASSTSQALAVQAY